jgi:hypothetical protein
VLPALGCVEAHHGRILAVAIPHQTSLITIGHATFIGVIEIEMMTYFMNLRGWVITPELKGHEVG